jgi:thioredoxin 1
MKTPLKIAILLVVASLVAGAIVLKHEQPPPPRPLAIAPQQLPKLLDLGATKCIPCKKMAPILAELKTTYAGKLEVEFIDVWQNTDAGTKYGIQLIPTQIFYDAAGKELFRHEGFYGREDILGKWRELGVNL